MKQQLLVAIIIFSSLVCCHLRAENEMVNNKTNWSIGAGVGLLIPSSNSEASFMSTPVGKIFVERRLSEKFVF